MLTFLQSVFIAITSHFVALLVLYLWVQLGFDRFVSNAPLSFISLGIYHITSLYVSLTGMNMAGFFQDMRKRDALEASIVIIFFHFIGAYLLSYLNEAEVYRFLRNQAQVTLGM